MSTIHEYASLKILPVKLSGIKAELSKKEYIFMCTWWACDTALLKPCQEKPSWIKNWTKKKEYSV